MGMLIVPTPCSYPSVTKNANPLCYRCTLYHNLCHRTWNRKITMVSRIRNICLQKRTRISKELGGGGEGSSFGGWFLYGSDNFLLWHHQIVLEKFDSTSSVHFGTTWILAGSDPLDEWDFPIFPFLWRRTPQVGKKSCLLSCRCVSAHVMRVFWNFPISTWIRIREGWVGDEVWVSYSTSVLSVFLLHSDKVWKYPE